MWGCSPPQELLLSCEQSERTLNPGAPCPGHALRKPLWGPQVHEMNEHAEALRTESGVS